MRIVHTLSMPGDPGEVVRYHGDYYAYGGHPEQWHKLAILFNGIIPERVEWVGGGMMYVGIQGYRGPGPRPPST